MMIVLSKNVLKFDTKPSSIGLTCYLLSGTKSIDVKVKYGIYHGFEFVTDTVCACCKKSWDIDEKKDDKVRK